MQSENFTERIKLVRKHFDKNQADFAKSLGMSRDAYANFEYDRLKNQSAKEPTIKAISQKYGIDEEWLRTGNGEMFAQKKGFSFDDYIKQRNLSDIDVQILKVFAELQPESRKDIIKNLQKIMLYIQEQDNADVPDTPEELVQQYKNPKAE